MRAEIISGTSGLVKNRFLSVFCLWERSTCSAASKSQTDELMYIALKHWNQDYIALNSFFFRKAHCMRELHAVSLRARVARRRLTLHAVSLTAQLAQAVSLGKKQKLTRVRDIVTAANS